MTEILIPTGPTSPRDPTSMQVLGYTDYQELLYDFDDSGNFYVYNANLISPFSPGFSLGFGPNSPPSTLICVSPKVASTWYSLNGAPQTTVVYNPFRGNPYPLSTVVTDP
jgi:hypothetical protein